ncbi:hypothetical protein STH2412 [Symbiobacterium thermophilum IAM 14863]|uniref:Uncharacterized protein n=1 Tax=Symbiobacterium thermophilum (strain DSM 24528 / JCM 14929 / IAM 14863 / T) TaxID=292459 RepID=Q67LP9_SYMTH|nr:hypothetical protein STH2412 [Symbiobacterium thermophilum IAM 14863]
MPPRGRSTPGAASALFALRVGEGAGGYLSERYLLCSHCVLVRAPADTSPGGICSVRTACWCKRGGVPLGAAQRWGHRLAQPTVTAYRPGASGRGHPRRGWPHGARTDRKPQGRVACRGGPTARANRPNASGRDHPGRGCPHRA